MAIIWRMIFTTNDHRYKLSERAFLWYIVRECFCHHLDMYQGNLCDTFLYSRSTPVLPGVLSHYSHPGKHRDHRMNGAMGPGQPLGRQVLVGYLDNVPSRLARCENQHV